MARYFFDVDDGEQFSSDDTGTVFKNAQDMRDAAIRLLAEIAVDIFPDGNQRRMAVTVRQGGDSSTVFTADLTLQAEWVQPVSDGSGTQANLPG
jgi:hypothetical protein